MKQVFKPQMEFFFCWFEKREENIETEKGSHLIVKVFGLKHTISVIGCINNCRRNVNNNKKKSAVYTRITPSERSHKLHEQKNVRGTPQCIVLCIPHQ